MKLLFALLLCILPVAFDLLAGRIYWKKKTVVAHMLTASVRLLIMAGLSYLNPSVMFWQSMLLSVSVHYFVFPILYNRLIILKEWDYVGTTALLDRAENWLRGKIGTLGVITLKVMFLASAIQLYINKCIHWDCLPF
jgi:hypothetical protein